MTLKFSKNLEEIRKNHYKVNKDNKHFVIASDEKEDSSIKKYVDEHTSGIRYDNIMMAGSIIASFDKFVSYVEAGYNIVKADVLNRDMISFEFQKLFNDKKGRGGK